MVSIFHGGALNSSLAQPMRDLTSLVVLVISQICVSAMRFGSVPSSKQDGHRERRCLGRHVLCQSRGMPREESEMKGFQPPVGKNVHQVM